MVNDEASGTTHFDPATPGQLTYFLSYRGADKSLARPTPRCIFLIVIIFRLMLVLFYIYININNIPPIMIINRIYETQNLLSL